MLAKNLNFGANTKVAIKAQNVLLDPIIILSDANWSVVGVMGVFIIINLGPLIDPIVMGKYDLKSVKLHFEN